jgi:hypothetical protein
MTSANVSAARAVDAERMSHGRFHCFALSAALVLLPSARAAPVCAPGDVLYMAIQPVQELVGYSGETRQQLLDRRYPGWQADTEQLVRRLPPTGDEALRVALTAPAGLVLERADIIVEASFEYIDRDNRRQQLVGHREIARYPIAADDARAEIAVPRSVFREPGALLVVVTARRADVAGARHVSVAAVPVDLSLCPRHIYTHDRSTAIRLNRGNAR